MAFRDTPLENVGLAGLGMDLMVVFFFCDFFLGLSMLEKAWDGCCVTTLQAVISCMPPAVYNDACVHQQFK
jgi:hypothetical protein